jgi:hypothetical protein
LQMVVGEHSPIIHVIRIMSWPCVFEAQFTALQQTALGYAPSNVGVEIQPLTQLCTNFGDGLVNYFKSHGFQLVIWGSCKGLLGFNLIPRDITKRSWGPIKSRYSGKLQRDCRFQVSTYTWGSYKGTPRSSSQTSRETIKKSIEGRCSIHEILTQDFFDLKLCFYD